MKVVYRQNQKRKGVSLWTYITLLVVATIILSFTGVAPEKKYKFEGTLGQFVKGDKWLSIAKQALSKSDLPSRDVSMIIDSLSEFQNAIVIQINSQLEAEKKINDSTKTKPKQ